MHVVPYLLLCHNQTAFIEGRIMAAASKVFAIEMDESKIVDFGDLLLTKSHNEILRHLQDNKLHLGDYCKNGPQHTSKMTVYRAILTHATNGDKLITQILNQSVSKEGIEDTSDSYLKVNFSALYSSGKHRHVSTIIKDMIDFDRPATRALLTHPVIETFLNARWRKWKKLFMINFIIYLLFLITYSVFLGK